MMTKENRDSADRCPGISQWENEVALVTGASSGIGWGVALALGRAGMRVVVTGRRKEQLGALVGLLNDNEAEGLAIPADFSREEDIAEMFERIRSEWGGVRVLINNAGLGYQEDLAQASTKSLRELLDVNVLALTICMQEAIKDMESAGFGQIINISSIGGHRVSFGKQFGMYSATKHAVKALTEAMWGELAAKGSPIKIGTISPGRVETEWHAKAFGDVGKAQQGYAEMKPLQPDDIADAVCYLLGTPPHVQINDITLRPIGQKE
jgi:NADP-dependent 3-hydroxy acid dehydrogenase YdfG